jgi:hypothetical protein
MSKSTDDQEGRYTMPVDDAEAEAWEHQNGATPDTKKAPPLDLRPLEELPLTHEDYLDALLGSLDRHYEDEPPDYGRLFRAPTARRLRIIKDHEPDLYYGKLATVLRQRQGFSWPDLDRHVSRDGSPQPSGIARLPPHETLTELLADDIPPPRQLFEGLMHDGMLLFGGKSKRGKSWLMFDLALALAVGRSGFRHYPCAAPMPVLYLALEDGRARLQGRARAIQPNITSADQLHLRYTFPPLAHGGLEALTDVITQYHYGLVVIDVLAKLETTPAGKSDRNYHDIYEMFTPLQDLRKEHPFCLAMLTHLRKQEADDVFDSLLGSVAYQGAQDVLWVLERKPKDDYAFLHIRDKDAEDTTIALRFLDGHWQYIGEGEEYEVSRDQRKIIKILAEEKREMGIDELRKAAGWPDGKYGYLRNILVAMVKDDLIHRAQYGKYSATIRATQEMCVESDDNDPVPF